MKTAALQIRTPEGIVFSQLLAGPVTRFLAWFIDVLCIGCVLKLLGTILTLLQILSPDFAGALYESRRDRIAGVDAAIASLAGPNDNARIGDWIRRFLTERLSSPSP